MEKLKINKKNLKWILLGIILAVLLEVWLTGFSICAGKWQERKPLDLEVMIEEGKLELTDCRLEAGSILSENSNARLIFHGTEDWGQVELSFGQTSSEATAIEWYNSPSEGNEFSRYRREEGYILPGGEEATLTLPAKNKGNLRIDIHENFRLDSISISNRVSVASLRPRMIFEHLNWVRMLVFLFFGAFGLRRYGKERMHKSENKKDGENHSKRLVYMDEIRVLAAVMVVVLHEIEPITEGCQFGSGKYIILKFISALSANCNLLFVMISDSLPIYASQYGKAY